ncbi:MAG TPA: protein kinase [Planctomycetota bacterium]|nr:protein kinase [Planctomycetota bacterium]
MKDDRHEREVDLFDRACDLPPAEREAFLDRECAGDPGMRTRVSRLLGRDAEPETGLDRPAVSALAGSPVPPEMPERLGGYRILGVLGRGGMGVVYLAEQESPKRSVALKVLRPGLLDRSLLRRFEHEALALGWLNHPGIAQIYEAGLAETPRGSEPFLAMEWVRGEPLTRHAERRGLSVKERLELLARVCDAVEHAHQKGVIHRDLKPGNILVDGSGQPKVLDFGVARITESDLQATTLHTRAGEIVGTLAYMSPEQLSGRPEEVDTRSDVYALGVIAYELLSGRMPHDLEGKPLPEATRVLVEREPARLSSVRGELRGDVTTIVAKSIEKEKDRRYASAGELANDLRRHLRDEPILARPSSGFYQLRKFARRNKRLTASLALAAAALLVGSGVALRQARIAEEARQLADRRASEALRQASRASLAGATVAAELGDLVNCRRLLDSVPSASRNFEWRHLDVRIDRSIARIRGASPFRAVGFSPATGELLLATASGEVERWDEEGIARRGTIAIGDPLEGPMAIGVGGTRLAGAFGPGGEGIGIWDLAAGRRLFSVETPGIRPAAVALSPDGTRVAFGGKESYLWNPGSSDPPRKIHAPSAQAFAFSGDGRRLASVYNLPARQGVGWFLDYDAATGQISHPARRHSELNSLGLALDPSASVLAVAYLDKRICLQDVQGDRLLRELRGHLAPVRAVAFDAEGKRLASGSDDRTVRLWDVATGAPLAILGGADAELLEVGFRPDGARVFGRTEREVLLWSTEAEAGVLGRHPTYVYAVAFGGGGARILSASYDGTLRISDAATGEPLLQKRVVGGSTLVLAAAARGPVFATAGGGIVRLWDGDAGAILRELPTGFRERVRAVALSADGSLLACRDVAEVSLWDTRTGERIRGWPCPSATDYSEVALSPGGERVAADDGTGAILVAEAAAGSGTRRLAGHSGPVEALAFDPSGTLLASGATDHAVRLWDAASGEARWVAKGHSDRVYALAFSPDGSRLASGSNDKTVRLWDVGSGEEVGLLRGHDDYVYSLAFSPDGSRLVSGSGDATFRVWDTMPVGARWREVARARGMRAGAESRVRELLDSLGEPRRVAEHVRADLSLGALEREVAIQALLRLSAGSAGGR